MLIIQALTEDEFEALHEALAQFVQNEEDISEFEDYEGQDRLDSATQLMTQLDAAVALQGADTPEEVRRLTNIVNGG